MRLAFLFFWTAAVGSGATMIQDDKAWKAYAPKEAAFEVRFPEEPTVRAGAAGFQVANVRSNGIAYTCQWLIREKPYDSKEAEYVYLLGNQVGAVTASRGKLVDAKQISKDNFQGRQFTIALNDKDLLRTQVYVAGKRIIVIQVRGTDKEAIAAAEPTQFFESLKIGKAEASK